MADGLKDIPPPVAPTAVLCADEASSGPPIPPQQRLFLYSADQWEGFIHEWAHFCLKKLYKKVERFSGAGDRGIDVAGFTDDLKLQGVWDNYQCKHFDHGLQPNDIWPEIGKILWYSYKQEYRAPRCYFFVAPRGAGTKLSGYLNNTRKLKEELIEQWDKHVRHAIADKQEIPLTGEFLDYVNAFDLSIFASQSPLQIIEDHKNCPHHVARFGGGLPSRPTPGKPPTEIAPGESRYVAQLLRAYAEHKKAAALDIAALKSWPTLTQHFGRQRESFYHAESLRVFARDTVPEGTFESLQEDIYSGVVDVHDADHADGYVRVCEVLKASRELQLTSNALLTRAKPKDRDGICHQLANEDRLKWTKE